MNNLLFAVESCQPRSFQRQSSLFQGLHESECESTHEGRCPRRQDDLLQAGLNRRIHGRYHGTQEADGQRRRIPEIQKRNAIQAQLLAAGNSLPLSLLLIVSL